MSRPTILIAGGGTGGHVFPAVAVAEAMQALADVDVVFCGTSRGVEARVIPERGWPLELLDVAPLKGGGAWRGIRAAAVAALATARAMSLVRRRGPRAVMGVGGYASGPTALAAAAQGVPLALLEPNRVLGLANRLLAPVTRRAYVASDEVASHFRPRTRRAYGVPLRAGFTPRPYVPRGSARVLVMGGSQGAAPLNDRLPAAFARVRGRVPGLEVTHQAGRDRDRRVRESYEREGLGGAVVVPFVDDVARAIADADLVVARAGAGTIAEVTAVGRASLLVPYPRAADDHQRHNAEAVARVGAAAWLSEDAAEPATLAGRIADLLLDDAARVAMADAARALGRPNAARDVAGDLLALAGAPLRAGAALGANAGTGTGTGMGAGGGG
ncbi:MAG: undecaprenyldiphospho-muramoylpentapeptide beta-N-acetylglucosaminyltransferase [Myxococcales bacterium]|nr:undecaprenyldiphospho-muramoylpentapeptide beta-N-acetylglucosaminyltransferase [Myxococcales bacterium]